MLRQQPPSFMHLGSAVSRFMVAAVLLLLSCPRSLLAQNGTSGGATLCFLQMLQCMITSDVAGGADCYFAAMSCVEGLPPDPPPAPPSAQPPSDDDACYGGEAVRGPGQARVAVSGPQPRDSQSCSGVIYNFVDPMSANLIDSTTSKVNTNTDVLANVFANSNWQIVAVAADGAARVVFQIPACKEGQVFTVALSPGDQTGGKLSVVDSSQTPSPSPIRVTSIRTTSGSFMAFAIYYAPVDFAEGNEDANAGFTSRKVSITVVGTEPDIQLCGRLSIIRPPVVLVHGLWADQFGTWNTFHPFIDGGPFTPNPGDDYPFSFPLFIRRADYKLPVTATDVVPSYPWWVRQVWPLAANSLGFAFNAPLVGQQIRNSIDDFRKSYSAAAVQADVVAHSMGGVVTRTWVKTPGFADYRTFGKGYIHKLITIGTPHLGSPLAVELGNTSDNSCTRTGMALIGNVAINTAKVSAQPVKGAIGDLNPLSGSLRAGRHGRRSGDRTLCGR